MLANQCSFIVLFFCLETIIINRWMSRLCKWRRLYIPPSILLNPLHFLFSPFYKNCFHSAHTSNLRLLSLPSLCRAFQPLSLLYFSPCRVFSASDGGKVPKGFYLVVMGSFYSSALKEISHKVKQALWSSSFFFLLLPLFPPLFIVRLFQQAATWPAPRRISVQNSQRHFYFLFFFFWWPFIDTKTNTRSCDSRNSHLSHNASAKNVYIIPARYLLLRFRLCWS
jgi:hypothetical protein